MQLGKRGPALVCGTDISGKVLEVVCNIPNTRDNFAGIFDTCAGSFDRLTSDPVLATDGSMRFSGNI